MTEAPYVDPNSGAAAQPGGFAHPPVVAQDGESTDVGADFSETSEADPSGGDDAKTDDATAPAGNAIRDLWVEWARAQNAPDAELASLEEGGLSRDELRTKYGS